MNMLCMQQVVNIFILQEEYIYIDHRDKTKNMDMQVTCPNRWVATCGLLKGQSKKII